MSLLSTVGVYLMMEVREVGDRLRTGPFSVLLRLAWLGGRLVKLHGREGVHASGVEGA